ncbi:uncharacterized protein EDB93DRAFT_1244870 [Suillus bovinus]|uniref:uncharacterized protein n=1 Tax=Suillus bovinus TaxID=48563 RepID=UPI001B85C96C|nr:uncharacterized protein EDB93DRAFT_1244870 [Suillus bovinus]KAG2160128.1 hypothetical protein EDB93DRAFT_1244870 [Suillus bovinus]
MALGALYIKRTKIMDIYRLPVWLSSIRDRNNVVDNFLILCLMLLTLLNLLSSSPFFISFVIFLRSTPPLHAAAFQKHVDPVSGFSELLAAVDEEPPAAAIVPVLGSSELLAAAGEEPPAAAIVPVSEASQLLAAAIEPVFGSSQLLAAAGEELPHVAIEPLY